jgi:hypothetical protein
MVSNAAFGINLFLTGWRLPRELSQQALGKYARNGATQLKKIFSAAVSPGL